jgi:hypothetical protein
MIPEAFGKELTFFIICNFTGLPSCKYSMEVLTL